jgi:hypothetical protein
VTVVGGLRARLLHDSLFAVIEDGLDILGWLDPDRSHRPIRFQAEPPSWNQPVEPNVIALQVASVDTDEVEVGSWLTTDTAVVYVNVYAESDSFGLDISNDLRDLLRGRLPSDGTGTFAIYDYRNATPPVVGHFSVRDVSALRNLSVTEDAWTRHWFRVRCEIQDTYYSSEA